MITSSLATLLTELEALTEITLLELTDPLNEFMHEIAKSQGENRAENQSEEKTGGKIGGTNANSPVSTPLQSSDTSQTAKLPGGNPGSNSTPQSFDAPGNLRGARTPQGPMEPTLVSGVPPQKQAEKISSITIPETPQMRASTPSFMDGITAKENHLAGRQTVENSVLPLPNLKTLSHSNEQRVTSQALSTPSSDVSLDPELQYRTSSPASEQTNLAPAAKINLTTIVSMRDLVRSILSQPGALNNQLEPGVFKTLMSALSAETSLQIIDTQTRASPVDTAGQRSESLSLARQLDITSRPPGRDGLAANKILEPLNANKSQAPKSSSVLWGLASTAQAAPTVTSTTEGLNPSNVSITSIPLTSSGQPVPVPKLSFGIFSDPALLAALQAAALRRNYSDILKRRKRPTVQSTQQHNRGERDNGFNDASRESTGLSLLRAFLDQRAPKTGTRI